MKTRILIWTSALSLFAGLALPDGLVGQELQQQKQEHHRYKLIDLGTLGGPSAYRSINAPGYQIINDAGVVSFAADTAMLDPNAPNCYFLDCFVRSGGRGGVHEN